MNFASQEFFRVAHFLAFNDHFEVSAILDELKSTGKNIPASLETRIYFYNMRVFCRPTYNLKSRSLENFFREFETMDAKYSQFWDISPTWSEIRRLFFVQRAISILFRKMGTPCQQRQNDIWVFNSAVQIDTAEYCGEIHEMFDSLIEKYPITDGYTDSYKNSLDSVTAGIIGTGKKSKLHKLSKTRLVSLVNGDAKFSTFTAMLNKFLKTLEEKVLPLPARVEIIGEILGEDELPEYRAFLSQF